MLIPTAITLMPCFFFMNWAARLIHQKDNTKSRKALLAVCIFGAITFFGDACGLVKDIHYGEYTIMSAVMQASTFLLFASFAYYLDTLEGKEASKTVKILTALPFVLMPLLTVWSISRIGLQGAQGYLRAYDFQHGDPVGFPEQAYRTYSFLVKDLHNILVGCWVVGMWTKLLSILVHKGMTPKRLSGFLKGKKEERLVNVMCLLSIVYFLVGIIRIASGRLFMLDHPFLQNIIYLVLGLLETNVIYIGYHFDGMSVSIDSEDDKEKEQTSDALGTLYGRIKAYIEDDKAYTDPALSIEGVADALSSNRTYISKAIKENTGKAFREYINAQRIEAVKQTLAEHPESHLEEIAGKTGFSSASQLAKKFREVTGQTPKAWGNKNRQH